MKAGSENDKGGRKSREQRLAEQLRANLMRRKRQARERRAQDRKEPAAGKRR